MSEHKRNWITWAFVAATILVVALMLMETLKQPDPIQLPPTDTVPGQSSDGPESEDALTVVAVTPETVQAAIASLARPEAYSRSVTVEQIWSDGSGTSEVTVSVLKGWTRTDRTLPGAQVRHTATNGETTYIWYNAGETVYMAAAGEISADMEQMIPTYEDILALPKDSIVAADFRMISEIHCIYVETAQDEAGYVLRYWVSVETGLLVAAERLLEGEPVYRMAALTVDEAVPGADRFTLPDGNILITE